MDSSCWKGNKSREGGERGGPCIRYRDRDIGSLFS